MPPAGFEPAIPVGDRPQTHALDSSATAIGSSEVFTIRNTPSVQWVSFDFVMADFNYNDLK